MPRDISSRLQFLIKAGAIRPEAWDFIIPHGPKFSVATKELAMAGVVRDIALNLSDKTLQKKLLSAGKEQVAFAAAGLINGWEDGDDICPPWWHPFPWPGPDPGPDPYPWYTGRIEGMREYANALKVIAGLSGVESVTKQLHEVADALNR